jgi:hypothetical protein
MWVWLKRKDEQALLLNKFTQWDWRVTPRLHGQLHLLLYVTPMIYIEGVGQSLIEFPQPPRVITVEPDYVYELQTSVVEHWAIYSTTLTAIAIPLLLWTVRKVKLKPRVNDHVAGFR